MKKILIIEDDHYLVRFYYDMQSQLRKKVDITVVDSGATALEKISNQDYDLILLDLLMPEIDGYAVLEELQANGGKKKPKLFVLTNLDTDEDREKTLEMGVDGYFVKADLSQRMLKHILEELEVPS